MIFTAAVASDCMGTAMMSTQEKPRSQVKVSMAVVTSQKWAPPQTMSTRSDQIVLSVEKASPRLMNSAE